MAAKLSVTIRATNGTSWVTDEFHENTRVDHVRRAAVRHFVTEGDMGDGDYVLALVRDGQAVPLADAQKLDEAGVIAGSTLALLVRGAQVDG